MEHYSGGGGNNRMSNVQVKCSLCGATMVYHPPTKPKAKDYFWVCPDCGCELWPYNESIEKQARKAMEVIKPRKKRGGSRRSRVRKTKKPGEKFVPWWMRF